MKKILRKIQGLPRLLLEVVFMGVKHEQEGCHVGGFTPCEDIVNDALNTSQTLKVV